MTTAKALEPTEQPGELLQSFANGGCNPRKLEKSCPNIDLNEEKEGEIKERLARNEEKLAERSVTLHGKKSMDLMSYEERTKELTRMEAELAQLMREALPGKCPIRFHEIDSEKIDWEHPILREPYESWRDALKPLTGTTDSEIAEEIFTKGLSALPSKNIARSANLAVQSLAEFAPQDAIEARLCMQEMALYSQGMAYLCRAENNTMLPQSDFYMKNALKLLRLHNETVEALNRHRRKGEQKVTVQHINIEDGGKAVIAGQMATGGGGQQ